MCRLVVTEKEGFRDHFVIVSSILKHFHLKKYIYIKTFLLILDEETQFKKIEANKQ